MTLFEKYFHPQRVKQYEWSDNDHRLSVRRHAMVTKEKEQLLFARHESGIVTNMPNYMYHQERAHVSSSALKMFNANPYKFKRLYCDEFAPELEADRDCLLIGSAVHAILFEPDGLDNHVVEIASPDDRPFSRRIKLHKEYEAALRRKHQDKLVMEAADIELSFQIAKAVEKNELAMQMLGSESVREVSLFARDPKSGVRIKCRLDFLFEYQGRPTILDCKTTAASCSPDGFATTAARYGYDVSSAVYRSCFQHITGVEPRFIFLAIEKDDYGDHQCALHEFDDKSAAFGLDEMLRMLDDLATCRFDDFKSPYVNKVNTISLPGWRLKESKKHE